MSDTVPAQGGHSTGARRARPMWVPLAIAAAVALVVGFGAGYLGGRTAGSSSGSTASNTTASGTACGSCDAVTIAQRVLPAIVTIHAAGPKTGALPAASGVGSGEIVRDNGYIVTNNHVISPALNGGTLTVVYSSGQEVDAQLVGRDSKSDLAVLKVATDKKLPVIALADSDRVAVGQPVVALGAPLGLSSTVTAGIISALDRDVPVPGDNGASTVLVGALQTDASINPGNSGGALVNCAGALVGVNTAIATVPNAEGTAGGGSVGIGFAVPTNHAERIVTQLIQNGKAVYPYFGVQVAPIPPSAAHQFGVEEGLFVQAVAPGGPADKAGIESGDVITKIDGASAANLSVLTRVTLAKQPGDTIQVTFVRDGAERTVSATLGAQ